MVYNEIHIYNKSQNDKTFSKGEKNTRFLLTEVQTNLMIFARRIQPPNPNNNEASTS